jgi:hypothetical protein
MAEAESRTIRSRRIGSCQGVPVARSWWCGDLLKRHSGIVWDPRLFAGLLCVGLRRSSSLRPPTCSGAPRPVLPLLHTQVKPGATQLTSPWADAPPDTMSHPAADPSASCTPPPKNDPKTNSPGRHLTEQRWEVGWSSRGIIMGLSRWGYPVDWALPLCQGIGGI